MAKYNGKLTMNGTLGRCKKYEVGLEPGRQHDTHRSLIMGIRLGTNS